VPLLWASGTGADVMRRLAAPVLGGLFTSFLMELLIYPVIFYVAKGLTLTESAELPPARTAAPITVKVIEDLEVHHV
jgi:Cu(I)/Ag(I) efflux system membrane protein CusA/SilA